MQVLAGKDPLRMMHSTTATDKLMVENFRYFYAKIFLLFSSFKRTGTLVLETW
jgi:hypothetical protein